MKKFKTYHILILALIVVAACQKENILKYNSQDSVYFYNADEYNRLYDSIVYTFRDHNSLTFDTIDVSVMLLGNLSDNDRIVNVIVDSTTASEGTDFKLIIPTIMAKETGTAAVKLVLYRTNDIKTTTKVIRLKLQDSDNLLAAKYPGRTSFTIKFSDKMEKPSWWPDYFWQYSETRMLFYISVLGSSADFFSENFAATLYALKVATAEYNATHEVPLQDEYGLITWDVSWVDD